MKYYIRILNYSSFPVFGVSKQVAYGTMVLIGRIRVKKAQKYFVYAAKLPKQAFEHDSAAFWFGRKNNYEIKVWHKL